MGWEVKDGPGGTFYFFTERTNCIMVSNRIFRGDTSHSRRNSRARSHCMSWGTDSWGVSTDHPFRIGENDGKNFGENDDKRET